MIKERADEEWYSMQLWSLLSQALSARAFEQLAGAPKTERPACRGVDKATNEWQLFE